MAYPGEKLDKKLEKKKKKADFRNKKKADKLKSQGYKDKKEKADAQTDRAVKVRKAKRTKGPKTVTTSYKEGDKTNIVKKKTTVTSSGASSNQAQGQKQKQNQSSNSSSSSKTKNPVKETPVKETPVKKGPSPQKPRGPGKPPKRGGDRKIIKPIERIKTPISKAAKAALNAAKIKAAGMKTGGMVNPNMRSMSVDAEKAYKSNAKRRNMPKGY
jgi:hypothetical protein